MTQDEKRQLLIVRQSQLERAMEYYKVLGIAPSLTELIRTAELLKDFVYEGINGDIKNRVNGFDTYVSKKKNKN